MFTRVKFLSLSRKQQHKHLMRLLAHAVAQDLPISDYNRLASFLGFPLLDMQTESISDRYHLHAKEALPHIKESDLLRFRCVDRLSRAPWLPVDIYLDALRSAANVGSILRTVEAFRLGTVFLSPRCAGLDRKKCRDSAMGCDMIVPVHTIPNPSSLRKPWVALEVAEGAASLDAFTFPPEMTLIVGNEEYGIAKPLLDQCDHIVQIPLVGSKNSLNVAAAFAVAAFSLRIQLDKKEEKNMLET